MMNANEKLFINALLSRKYVEETRAKELFRDLQTNRVDDVENPTPSQEEFDRFWGLMSKKLREKMGIEIRRIKFVQGDDKLYLGICNVNSIANEPWVNSLPTKKSPKEIALFRVILDEILKTEDTCRNGADIMDLINASRELIIAHTQKPDENKGELGNVGNMTQATTQVQVETMGKMTPSEREIAVADFCNEGWLFRPKAEKVKIGVRSFLELKEFILDQCPEEISEEWKNAL